jgi:glycosyltransferase involved in cell wall biosynthesis
METVAYAGLARSRTPAVSVLMTAYNREGYIRPAVESVLQSTFEDLELIIVDDNSQDNTAAIAREYEAADERVRVYCNETNLGDYPNRNRAAGYARAPLLKYVDSDDIIYPHGLDVMCRCVEAFPDAGMAVSAPLDRDAPYPTYLTPREAYLEHFFVGGTLGRAPGSTIIRRRAFEAVGGFSGGRQVGDHELWLAIARSFGVVKMPADLIWSRQHAEQEKNYDSEIEKTVMHEEVLTSALLAADCPLSEDERDAALGRMRRNRARNYWRFMTQAGGVRAAEEYRRLVHIPLSTLASFTVDQVRRAGNPVRSGSPKQPKD